MTKTFKIIAVSVVATGLAGLIGLGVAQAKSTHNDVQLNQNQIYQGAFIRSGQNVTIDGTVHGDVIVAGQTVTIDGNVTGNVYAAGQTITVHGVIGGNAHLTGGTVELAGNGMVKGSLYTAGGTVKLDHDSVVGAALFALSSNVQADGRVGGQIYAAASTLSINNAVGSDVTAAVSQLNVQAGANITGNLKYYSGNDATIDGAAKIAGSITRQAPKQTSRRAFFTARVGGALFGVLSWFIIGLILLAAMPKRVVKAADDIHKSPWQSFGTGLLFIIATPIAILIGLISVVGLMAAIIAALLYAVILMVSLVFVALWFGRLVLSYKNVSLGHNLIALLIGLVVLALLRLLPILGGVVTFVAFSLGAGTVVRSLWSGLPKSTGAKKSTT